MYPQYQISSLTVGLQFTALAVQTSYEPRALTDFDVVVALLSSTPRPLRTHRDSRELALRFPRKSPFHRSLYLSLSSAFVVSRVRSRPQHRSSSAFAGRSCTSSSGLSVEEEAIRALSVSESYVSPFDFSAPERARRRLRSCALRFAPTPLRFCPHRLRGSIRHPSDSRRLASLCSRAIARASARFRPAPPRALRIVPLFPRFLPHRSLPSSHPRATSIVTLSPRTLAPPCRRPHHRSPSSTGPTMRPGLAIWRLG